MSGAAVSREQRFSKANPCPICSGFDQAARGKGVRCHGFLSDDGRWANCSRDDHAGALPGNSDSGTYGHRVAGPCLCGAQHSAASPSAVLEKRGDPLAVYPYCDESGALLFEVCRFYPKRFLQRRYDAAGGMHWNLEDARRVLYRLPEMLKATREGRTVYLVEGEQDSDALASLGLTATTNPQGAGKWSDDYTRALSAARRVVILPDNDTAGRDHAQKVAGSLHAAGVDVRVLELPGLPEKGDVSDWLRQGGNRDMLENLAEAAPEWAGKPPGGVSFADLLRTQPKAPEWQVDRLCERGDVLVLGGQSGSGKSFLALGLVLAMAAGRRVWGGFEVSTPGRVVYLDAEMGERRMTRRAHRIARGLGIEAADIENRAHLLPGAFPLDDEERFEALKDELLRFRGRGSVDFLVFDTLRRFMAGEEQDSGSVARYFSRVKELQAALGGPTVLIVHHTRKRSKTDGPDAGDRLRGSSDILAAADSVLLVDGKTDGLLRMLNPKNRERELAPFAVRLEGWDPEDTGTEDHTSPLRLVYEGDAAVMLTEGHAVQTALVAFLQARPGQKAPRQEILAAMKGKWSARTVSSALSALKAENHAGSTGGNGAPAIWYLKRPGEDLGLEEVF